MLQEIRGSGTLTHTQNKNKTKYTRNCYRKSAIVAPLHMNRDVKFTVEHQQTLH